MSFVPKGIIPPVVTPTREDGTFNEAVFRKLIRHLMDSGIHGLFPMGTTGEFYGFSNEDYRHILEVAVDAVGGKIPVYAGTSSITPKGTIELLRIAEDAGANAASVLTPMFVSQTQDEVYEYYRTVAQSTSLPIIIYNNKPKTNVTVAPETVAKLAEIPNIVGVKDSTGDMTNTEEYIRLTRDRDDFHVLLGRDTLIYAGLCYGASGAIASCANVAPKLAVSIYDNFMAGNLKAALDAQFEFAPLRILAGMGSFPEVIKEGLMMEGYDVGKCLAPIQELTPAQKEKLSAQLKKMKLI
jgi:4-hydroxy-tetrahydrodipicolinate synthase